PRKIDELNIQFRFGDLPFCELNHSGVWFECKQFIYFRWFIVDEVHAGADADLQDVSLSQGENPPTNFANGLRIAQHAYQMRINVRRVEGHRSLQAFRIDPRSSRRKVRCLLILLVTADENMLRSPVIGGAREGQTNAIAPFCLEDRLRDL